MHHECIPLHVPCAMSAYHYMYHVQFQNRTQWQEMLGQPVPNFFRPDLEFNMRNSSKVCLFSLNKHERSMTETNTKKDFIHTVQPAIAVINSQAPSQCSFYLLYFFLNFGTFWIFIDINTEYGCRAACRLKSVVKLTRLAL
jgi:hypothetical protein